MILASQITGLVLAGGRGLRMGGADKGLLPWAGTTLVGQALARLAPQVDHLAISANRHLEDYQALGVPVWTDSQAFEGPLGGMLAGFGRCQTPWLLCVPCDAPFFPLDLAARLAGAAGVGPGQSRMAVAWAQRGDGEAAQPQPVFCLMHSSLRERLREFLAGGGRRAGEWARQADAARVDFDAEGFRNLNTPEDLASFAAAAPDSAAPAG